jgi:site-specific recombinase XerD
MPDVDLVRHFVVSRATLSGDRPRTVERLQRICRLWQTFLEERGGAVASARATDLLAFVAHRQAAGVKDSTIREELCVVRTFYGHLLAHGKVAWSPAVSLPSMICAPPAEKAYLTVAECLAILKCLDTADPLGLRDYVIVALLWSTGLRSRELVALTWRDVDLDHGAIVVRDGKGGKQRQIFLNDHILADLRGYRARLGGADHEPVFRSSAPGPEVALSARRLVDIVGEGARQAGIVKPVSPLTFRHTFATHMFEAGAALDDIKELMGHSDPTETTVYVHVSLDAAKQLLNDHVANPLKYS